MPASQVEAAVQYKMSMAFTNLEAYLNTVLGKLHRQEGILVSDEFNMQSMATLWRTLRMQMDNHGYREAVNEQVLGLQRLADEIEEEVRQLGGPRVKTPQQFSGKSDMAITLLMEGADRELIQVANNASEAMGQVIRRAALGGVDFSDMLFDIQKQLNIHRAQAQTLITTTLHSFNSHIMVTHAQQAGVKWYAYLGPNEQRGSTIWMPDSVIRNWCWQWEGFRGTLEMFEMTAEMWGRGNHPHGIAAWRGGWRCRHLLNPLMGKDVLEWPIGPRDAVVRAQIMSSLGIAA